MDAMTTQAEHTGGAETVLGLQPNSSITIAYHSLFGPHDDLMLLEVDEKLLNEVMDERVTIRGNPDEEAVLCTSSKTYAIKFVGTSNSVFLIPPIDDVSKESDDDDKDNIVIAPVLKVAPGCMELVEVAPKLDRLKSLLSEKPYTYGDMSEMNVFEGRDKGLYTWEDLVERLQASDEELRLGLESISAVEINGYWRVLDEKYMNSILNMLLNNVILNDWSIYALNEVQVLDVLESDEFPRIIANHCLRVYCNKVDDDDGFGSTWKLDERRVCVELAREILREGKMKIDIFMDKWTRKIPDGVIASFDMLEGEVLMEKMGVESWVYLFRVSSLPSTPAERFSLLFKEKAKWEWKDLEPYVRDLKVPGLSSEGLLLKYTRRTQANADAEPVFSAR